MARRLGDPQLLTMALNATVLEHYGPAGHDERRRAGRELLRVADEAHLVSAGVLGHMALAQTDAAGGDLASADQHVAVVETLAETYEQPLTAAIAAWYHGLRHVVAGDLDAALAAYGEADRRMREVRMWQGAEDTISVSIACAWLAAGRLGELAACWDAAPRLDPELHALALAHAGRIEEAREAAGRPGLIRPDYTMDLRWAVR
jgi:tetratricopeptide (TPR) repeat protein